MVPAAQFGSLAEGMPARLTGPARRHRWCLPSSAWWTGDRPASNTFRIRLSLDNTGHRCRPGALHGGFRAAGAQRQLAPGDRRPSPGDPRHRRRGPTDRLPADVGRAARAPRPAGVRRASMASADSPAPPPARLAGWRSTTAFRSDQPGTALGRARPRRAPIVEEPSRGSSIRRT